MTKMLLVNPYTGVQNYNVRPLSLPIIATHVTRHSDCEADILDMELNVIYYESKKQKGVEKCLSNLVKEAKKYDILGFTSFTYALPKVLLTLEFVKEGLGDAMPLVVAGGPHPSAAPTQTLNESKGLIDAVVIGQGEGPMAMLGNGTPLDEVPNLAYKKNGRVRFTKKQRFDPFNETIEADFLESCYAKVRSIRKEDETEAGVLSEISKRGCDNYCDYCSCPRLPGGVFNRSPEIIAEEVAAINERSEVDIIDFVDDNHFEDMKYVEALTKALKERGIDAEKSGYLNLSTARRSDIAKITKMGYPGLSVGRDFITNRLAGIYGRRTNGKIRDVEAEKKMLRFMAENDDVELLQIGYIIPAPHYTMGEIRDTVREMAEFSYRDVRAGPLAPFPGTPVRRRLRKEGLIRKGGMNDWLSYGIGYNDNILKFKDKRVENWRQDLSLCWTTINAFLSSRKHYMSSASICAITYATATFTEKEAMQMIKFDDSRWRDAVVAHDYFLFLKDHKEAANTVMDYFAKRLDSLEAIAKSKH